MEEQILVVEDAKATLYLPGEGFLPSEESVLQELTLQAKFHPRSLAEGNTLLRQLIPYVVLLRAGEAFAVTRTRKQSESRLHDKLSIGIGGHLNEVDVAVGAMRELTEELLLDEDNIGPLSFLGFINDLSSAVSRDHLGCLFICQVSGEIEVRESDKMWGEFRSRAFLEEHVLRLEGWSKIALQVLSEKGYLGAQASF